MKALLPAVPFVPPRGVIEVVIGVVITAGGMDREVNPLNLSRDDEDNDFCGSCCCGCWGCLVRIVPAKVVSASIVFIPPSPFANPS